jgi:type I restriction enzyme S subunit
MRQIVQSLACIDDRITLLRETNTTLEAIAQALFKSWFVDFDPVHAKMQGRTPEGMDEATTALFPDSFEDSELGPVPKGWRIETLGDVCSYLNRGISPKYLEEGGVLVINQKCIRDFSVDYSKARRHDSAQRKIDGRQVEVGDILVNSTGVGTLGRVAQVLTLDEVTIVDSHVTVVRAGEKLSWPYLGQWMIRQQPNIEAMGEGSTGQTELARSKLAVLPILVPSADALMAFDALVKSLKERVAVNEAGASGLAKLRDTLLPRLISGQLRISEAQNEMENV